MKRRHSQVADESGDGSEKRQRIEGSLASDKFDLASIIAQATATAEQSFTDATMRAASATELHTTGQAPYPLQLDNGHAQGHTAGLTSGFSTDPQLYMRILSLPMLESLVSIIPGLQSKLTQ